MKTWSKSRGTHGIALNGEDWYDVRHGLIITPDGTAKERPTLGGPKGQDMWDGLTRKKYRHVVD